ncbi:hypothetical protein [Paraburkholderia sp.]|uniref:hypothetical protein n=1 Tax=Paraburkholderia sp. TaxID=1926495 RepID=UPI0023A2FDF2|nr:hypothetical protein [Paraburkholderia sp.]MDE1182477.1 hypothetical protein [Paraburkholderia sp.]
MKTRILATLLLAASASIAAPAFASGYGPAPFYRPDVSAPASQRGQSVQTVAAENANANVAQDHSYGGVKSQTTQSGSRQADNGPQSVFFGH